MGIRAERKEKIAVVAFIDHGIGAGARHMIYSVLYFTTGRYLENNSSMIDIVILVIYYNSTMVVAIISGGGGFPLWEIHQHHPSTI